MSEKSDINMTMKVGVREWQGEQKEGIRTEVTALAREQMRERECIWKTESVSARCVWGNIGGKKWNGVKILSSLLVWILAPSG